MQRGRSCICGFNVLSVVLGRCQLSIYSPLFSPRFFSTPTSIPDGQSLILFGFFDAQKKIVLCTPPSSGRWNYDVASLKRFHLFNHRVGCNNKVEMRGRGVLLRNFSMVFNEGCGGQTLNLSVCLSVSENYATLDVFSS